MVRFRLGRGLAAIGAATAITFGAIRFAVHRARARGAKRIVGLTPRPDTTALLKANMGAFIPTWSADGEQYLAIGEGSDFDAPREKSFYGAVYRLLGNPPDATLEALPAYPAMPLHLMPNEYAEARCGGVLAIGSRIYSIIFTPNRPYIEADGSFASDWRWELASKIIYSDDSGRTWRNSDGSYPVRRDKWEDRDENNSLFYDEPYRFTSFLQMGKGYEDNKDGYVYLYGLREGEEMILARVRTANILHRDAYQFFAGFHGGGDATWSKDIGKVATVFQFPSGWKSTKDDDGMVPAGWNFSAVYNRPLNLYMMVGQGTGSGSDGGWHGKSPYLGFWVAPTPWGPFRQIHEDQAWKVNDRDSSRPYNPQIPPKWISADGRSFWITWSDYETKITEGDVNNPDAGVVEYLKELCPKSHAEFSRGFYDWNVKHQASLGMNMQRIDLMFG